MALTLLPSCQGPALKIHHYPGRLLPEIAVGRGDVLR